MIVGWRDFAFDNLLTINEKAAFIALQDEKIKGVIERRLQRSCLCSTMSLTKEALNILFETSPSPERERFIACLLDGEETPMLGAARAVYQIIKKGFFPDLLTHVKVKTKKYHSPERLVELIHQFNQKTPPLLQNGNDHGSTLKSRASDGCYKELQNHNNYNNFSSKVEQFLTNQMKEVQNLFANIFHTLDFQYTSEFTDQEKLELIQAALRIFHPTVQRLISSYNILNINELIIEAAKLKSEAGEEILALFFHSLRESEEYHLDEITSGLYLLNIASNSDDFFLLLDNWKKKKSDWNELSILIEHHQMNQKQPPAFLYENISVRLERFRHDPTITLPLSEERIAKIAFQFEEIKMLCTSRLEITFIHLMQEAHIIRQKAMKHPIEEEERLKLVAIGYLAIRAHFEINLNSTQVLAVLALFSGTGKDQSQIKTGEGKSFILTLWCFVKAMECRSIDIITSARYLAIRDQRKVFSFFNRAGITTSHICYDEQKPSHFRAQILYGPTSDFEFAWMKDRLYKTALYEARLTAPYVKKNFDCVAVDESDNLLIDAMGSGARLAFPAEISFDFIYSPLLSFIYWVCTAQNDAFSLEEKYLIQFRQFIDNLDHSLDSLLMENTDNLLSVFISTLLKKANIETVISLTIARARKYLIDQTSSEYHERIQQIEDSKISQWLFSAHHAQFHLNDKIDYVVSQTRDQKGVLQRTIQIVDLKTGRIAKNSRWQCGIHEFLEVKHGIPVEKESLNPINLSHAVFYQFYNTITALTGTSERKQTKRIYHIETFDIPPHLPLLRVDYPIEIVPSKEHYYLRVLLEIRNIIKAKRPHLILCSNIMETEELAKRVKNEHIKYQLLNEIQEELEHSVIEKAGKPGMVTIATNTAGRGTDIILSADSLTNGGLHTTMTFYAEHERVEIQGLGRSGRQGQKGSSRILLHRHTSEVLKALEGKPHNHYTDQELIALLKAYREQEEENQVTQNIEKAELERFTATFTHLFYDAFQTWSTMSDSEKFITFHSENLNKIKLRKTNRQFTFNHLPVKDRLIATECIKLLKTKDTVPMNWKVLLNSAVQRMKDKTIAAWCFNFHHEVENLMQGSGSLIKKKNKIHQHYNNNKDTWTNYMTSDGAGLYSYLEEITTLEFTLDTDFHSVSHVIDGSR